MLFNQPFFFYDMYYEFSGNINSGDGGQCNFVELETKL